MNDNKWQASDAGLVRKVLQVLEILKNSPAGSVVYRQVEQLLSDLEHAHLRAERTYASLLYTLLDAYLQHLPTASPLYVQVKVLQQRLQPPLSLLDSEALRTQIELYADHIAKLHDLDVQRLGRVLAPLLNGAPEPDRQPAERSRDLDDAGPADEAARANVSPDGRAEERRSMIRRLQESLSREIRETISQNQEFGVMLDLVLGELQHVDAIQDIDAIRQHLVDQVKRLHQGHYALAEKLDSADRYLRIIELDSEQLTLELTHARQMSLTDELTSLPNRRAFLNRLEDEVARVQRYGMPLALAIIDLDSFKAINDRYGHAAGDAVLRCYAGNVFSTFRHHDMVARYGGEEFAVLLPNTDSAGALRALMKIRGRAGSQVCKSDQATIQLPTFSAGVAVYQPGEPPHGLIERADRALYHAKALGRDRVEIDPVGAEAEKPQASSEDGTSNAAADPEEDPEAGGWEVGHPDAGRPLLQ
ncbi:MAG: GGDEF domain-containing protein [Gammaproteobacteria bacterium]